MAPCERETVFQKVGELEEPTRTRRHTKYNYPMIIRLAFAHVLGLYAIVFRLHHMRIWTIAFAVTLTMLAILGTTAGAHRLWSHRSYKATWPLRVFLFGCFALTSHVSIYNWVQFHRIHHKHADTEADPHNSRRGFFFAHIGWLMVGKTPEYLQRKKEADLSDILTNPLAKFHSRFFLSISYALLFLPSLIPILMWGEDFFLSFLATGILRSLGTFHSIASINSFTHMYGSKPYNKGIFPTEIPVVSFFSLGEGWHNYHHTFPWDYKAAEFSNKFNLTARFLELCAKLGLAYDLKTASPNVVSKTKQKKGDGCHLYEDNYQL